MIGLVGYEEPRIEVEEGSQVRLCVGPVGGAPLSQSGFVEISLSLTVNTTDSGESEGGREGGREGGGREGEDERGGGRRNGGRRWKGGREGKKGGSSSALPFISCR